MFKPVSPQFDFPKAEQEVLRFWEENEIYEKSLKQREGRPEHVAQAVVFLVENEFIPGVCLPVDGGRTIAGGEGDRPVL